ncbi:Alpha N-terminal protein methyltransferase 1 [Frankliniella fusca]|uniref:Alpha N-terminal protein methyltransferase 1 n=1 Tax=Frankliniella fusca TaxID=407009 RepID=A0AAE1L749_9NEOP|nr:Alpha N-terminal protein methyltransferase 1 [Frankliniella fusca]
MEDLRCDQPVRGIVENKERGAFYQDAADYWSQIPATVDGMLGGYGHISTVDINGSTQFLRQLFRLKVPPGKGCSIDCGAGIGRITKNLLFNHFKKVDLVEQNPAFVAQARAALESHDKMGNFYCSGLQDFEPTPNTYDVIWCQWVLGHLTDDDLIKFFQRCIRALKKNGIIVVKENCTTSDKLDEDPTDSSVTRPLDHLCRVLQEAGLKCVKQKRQTNFPHGLYPVYMIATRPLLNPNEEISRAKLDTDINREVCEHKSLDVSLEKVEITTPTITCFEEEAIDFQSKVEYSSDDSTKTESDVSTAKELAEKKCDIF